LHPSIRAKNKDGATWKLLEVCGLKERKIKKIVLQFRPMLNYPKHNLWIAFVHCRFDNDEKGAFIKARVETPYTDLGLLLINSNIC